MPFLAGDGWYLEKVVIEEGELVENTAKGDEGEEKDEKAKYKKDSQPERGSEEEEEEEKEKPPTTPGRVFVFPCSRYVVKQNCVSLMGTSSIRDGCSKIVFQGRKPRENDFSGHPSSIDDVAIKLIQLCYYCISKFMSNRLI